MKESFDGAPVNSELACYVIEIVELDCFGRLVLVHGKAGYDLRPAMIGILENRKVPIVAVYGPLASYEFATFSKSRPIEPSDHGALSNRLLYLAYVFRMFSEFAFGSIPRPTSTCIALA